MDKTIRDIVMGIQYLYPCIAFSNESFDGKELLITAETYLTRLYPLRKSVNGMISVGDDYWSRALFKDDKELYYCEIDGELYFKGNDPEGEPYYPVKHAIIYESPEIDADISEIKPCIEKVKTYIREKTGFKLIEVKTTLKEDVNDPSRSKIVCSYKLSL